MKKSDVLRYLDDKFPQRTIKGQPVRITKQARAAIADEFNLNPMVALSVVCEWLALIERNELTSVLERTA